MNKNIIISILVFIIVIGGIVFWKVKSPSTSYTADNLVEGTSTTATSTPEKSFTGTGSFMDIVQRGGSYKCTFTYNQSGAASNGTLFVSGSKLSGDFQTTIPQTKTTVEMHIVNDGTWVYSWNSVLPGGAKTKTSVALASTKTQTILNNTQTNYSCSPVLPDPSKFVAPANITFTEVK